MSSPTPPSIDVTQAQRIIDHHFGGTDDHSTIVKLVELENQGYSHTPDLKTYVADLQKPGSSSPPSSSCFITISHPTLTPPHASIIDVIYPRPSLPLIAHLLSLIRTHTSIPIRESTLDTSLSTIPFHYLLSPLSPFPSHTLISLPLARASGLLSPQAQLSIELLLGQFLGQLHSGVQNDWYGLPIFGPGEGGGDERYSWQETFTGLMDRVLTELEVREHEYELGITYSDVHRYLSRAIASFLFDDVEVPSLVWLTGSEHDIYITLPSPSPSSSSHPSLPPASSPTPGTIAAILPNITHALWGDPLLESLMMGPALGEGPSRAFMEGYAGGGGGPVLVFARQKTKRMWYTLFLAGVVLLRYGPGNQNEDGEGEGEEEEEEEWIGEKRRWARDVIGQCVERLRDAPCY
ncbi:hypothetical protein Hypma_005406 [Hypsizygus marmoreus]|uniref:Aminoglycoside phosphotransferase domain-containing protein n=1 Tax=Hypsizygus marmoreus TaxID=39966 RepID=A0A369K2F4_HYPMA|nr:hypothetical protein Hypma_005406 [Hypsizygus marmoreus]